MEKLIKESNFISAVIYVYNCEDTIYEFLKMLDTNFEKHYKQYELICVNDSSNDESINEIKRYSKEAKGSISILNMSFYQGLELSMNAGMDLAIGDFVYQFDFPISDCKFEIIHNIYTQSLKGYDIVSVSPKKNKNILSNIFYKVYNLFSKNQYAIKSEYFRILSRRAINRVNSLSKTIPYRKAVYSNCGLKVYSMSLDIEYQPSHYDKLSENKELATNTLLLYTNLGYKFAVTLTSVMILVMLTMAIYTLGVYIKGEPIAGWTSTILFLSFAFMGIFALLSIIIKYSSLILNLVFTRQQYLIESIEKIK